MKSWPLSNINSLKIVVMYSTCPYSLPDDRTKEASAWVELSLMSRSIATIYFFLVERNKWQLRVKRFLCVSVTTYVSWLCNCYLLHNCCEILVKKKRLNCGPQVMDDIWTSCTMVRCSMTPHLVCNLVVISVLLAHIRDTENVYKILARKAWKQPSWDM
jgi:hypothetical protein